MQTVQDGTERPVTRRNLLRATAAASLLAGVGEMGVATAATTTARSYTDPSTGDVFLGGDFLELGIRPDGGFGSDRLVPSSFYGSRRGRIGMYGNFNGFANDRTYEYDYFLPGSPEERFSVGYRTASAGERVESNGNLAGDDIPTTVTDISSGDMLAASVSSTFDGVLAVTQVYRFRRSAKFYDIEVTLENVGSSTLNDVRYQRSVDPDNGQDIGCGFDTKNTVVEQQPADGSALVVAELPDTATCAVASESSIPMFYRSTDDRARVSFGRSFDGLVPGEVVYGARDYDSAPPAGSTGTDDTYVAITFDVGSLAPGESTTFKLITGLTNDVEETIEEADGPAPAAPTEPRPRRSARFRVVESSVEPERVTIGEPVTVAATVRNVGEIGGRYIALFQDDTRLYGSERVRLDPEEEHTFEFTVAYDGIGTNRLFLRYWNVGEVRVTRPQEPVVDAADVRLVEASVSDLTTAPGDRYRVVAAVRNDGGAAGVAPVRFVGTPVGAADLPVVDRTRRPVLDPGETATVEIDVRARPSISGSYRRTWVVNGEEVATVSTIAGTGGTSSGAADGGTDGSGSGGSNGSGTAGTGGTAPPTERRDGIVEASISPRTVAPGEEYEITGVVRNGRERRASYALSFHQGGSPRDIVIVGLEPGETREITRTMAAPQEPGTLREWFVSYRSAGKVTVREE